MGNGDLDEALDLHNTIRILSKYYTDISNAHLDGSSCYISVKPAGTDCHFSGAEIDFSYIIINNLPKASCTPDEWPAHHNITQSASSCSLSYTSIFNDRDKMLNDLSDVYNDIETQYRELSGDNWNETGVQWQDISADIEEYKKRTKYYDQLQKDLALINKKNEISNMKINSIFIELILFIITVFLLIILLFVSFKFSEISILDKILYAILIVVGIYIIYNYIHNKYFNTI